MEEHTNKHIRTRVLPPGKQVVRNVEVVEALGKPAHVPCTCGDILSPDRAGTLEQQQQKHRQTGGCSRSQGIARTQARNGGGSAVGCVHPSWIGCFLSTLCLQSASRPFVIFFLHDTLGLVARSQTRQRSALESQIVPCLLPMPLCQRIRLSRFTKDARCEVHHSSHLIAFYLSSCLRLVFLEP